MLYVSAQFAEFTRVTTRFTAPSHSIWSETKEIGLKQAQNKEIKKRVFSLLAYRSHLYRQKASKTRVTLSISRPI
jgi:hypothetical protein